MTNEIYCSAGVWNYIPVADAEMAFFAVGSSILYIVQVNWHEETGACLD